MSFLPEESKQIVENIIKDAQFRLKELDDEIASFTQNNHKVAELVFRKNELQDFRDRIISNYEEK